MLVIKNSQSVSIHFHVFFFFFKERDPACSVAQTLILSAATVKVSTSAAVLQKLL